ncbi:MAG: hypothetical protein SGBAC_013524, partial [Bacillariaceae sp.]
GIGNFGIVDDEAELLFKWKRRAEATGMKYMRSSATFHLDVAKDALTQFAASQHGSQGQQNVRGKSKKKFKVKGNTKLFASDYDRPSLELFNLHCDHVIRKYHLDQHHIAGTVESINLADDMVTVTVGGPDPQTLRAKNIVLALGSDRPSRPSWAHNEDIQFSHLLDTESTTSTQDVATFPSKVAIVGGGVSAVHKALDIVTRNKGSSSSSSSNLPLVHIISRHDLHEQQFDTHQEWMMDQDAVQRSLKAGGGGFPQRQLDFRQLKSYSERRKVIQQERRAGTVPASLSRKELKDAIRSQRVEWHVGDITRVTPTQDKTTCLQLATKDGTVKNIIVDQVLLATGFGTKPPGSDTFLSKLADSENLPLSPHCGYPIVDSKLRWFHPRLYVAGALAELELGPSARNLAGARMVAERIFGENA